MSSSFGMFEAYINFMDWFLYGLAANVFDDCIICFGELYVMGIKIFLSLRVRL